MHDLYTLDGAIGDVLFVVMPLPVGLRAGRGMSLGLSFRLELRALSVRFDYSSIR